MKPRKFRMTVAKSRTEKKRGRACGTCSACCTSMAVEEIGKVQDVACDKLAAKGCGIYDTRPQSCRDFKCLWLVADDVIRGDDRPDRCGLVLDVNDATDIGLPQAIVAHEAWSGAATQAAGATLIAELSRIGVVIIRAVDGNRRLKGPAHLVAAYQAHLLRKPREDA